MDKLIAKLKRHIEQHGPLTGKDLTALIDGLSSPTESKDFNR